MTTPKPHGPADETTTHTGQTVPSAVAVTTAGPWPDVALCQCGCGEPAPIAKTTDRRLGYVKGEPLRYIRWHKGRERAQAAEQGTATDTTCACGAPVAVKKAKQCKACYERDRRRGVRRRPTDIDRFMAKVCEGAGDCWEWSGATNANGYGLFHQNGRVVRAHRWSYQYFRSEIPDGLDLDHLCRNRKCVNPWHLEPVTKAVNSLRGEAPRVKLWRENKCARGHDLTNAYVRKDTGARMCRECVRIRWAEKAADPEFKAARSAYERQRRMRTQEAG